MGVADEMCDWWLRRWRPDLVPHGAALGASGPSPGRTTRRQLVVARSGAGSLHGPRWGRQVPAATLVSAALPAAGHGEAEHQDEQDRGDDEQDAPHGPPPCPYLHLCAGEPGAPNYSPHPPSAASSCAPGRYGAAAWPFPRTLRRARGISPYSSGGRAVALCRALCPSSCTGSLQSWINPDDQVHHAPAEQGGCASYRSFRTVPDDWHRLKNRKVSGSIPSLPTRLPRSAAYAMRLPAGQSPGLRHRRAPGHASSHGEEPDDGSHRSSGQVLITRAAAAVARRRDPTNPAPAQPPGAGGAGAGGAPQDWGQGARSRDTVRLRAPWPPLGKRSLIERSASSYPKRTEIYRDLGLSNIRASYRVRAAGPV